jgi:vacuolar-type H+-ATPase subunit E/Vma4
MEEIYERLTKQLLNKNDQLTKRQALTWVEVLWEDFETTRAKAGRKYLGQSVTENIVSQWINQYGERIHEFAATNPKYAHLLKDNDHYQ